MISDLMADSIAWKNEKSRDRSNQSKQIYQLELQALRRDHLTNAAGYFDAQTHRERQKRGPSRRLPIAPSNLSRPDPYDRHRSDATQSISTSYSSANRSALDTSPPAAEDTFTESMSRHRSAGPVSQRNQSFITRGEAEQIIARRLRDSGQEAITRRQFESLIDKALGQASATQEQFLTPDQAQTIIVQRLKAAGKTKVTKAELEGLVNQQLQESKQENLERVVNEAMQKGQERPVANQGRPASQAAPPSRPPPRNPRPDGSYGHPDPDPDYSRHKKPS
jgi:hypothetical protein